MSYMQTDGIKIDKHFPTKLGQYFMDGFGSDGTVVKGLSSWSIFEKVYGTNKDMKELMRDQHSSAPKK